jgi:hypothetical protein
MDETVSLGELRRTLRLPQREVARRLRKGQEEISRIENRADLRLSTLQSYVRSLGGTLELLCRFKDRAPVRLRTSPREPTRTSSTGKRLPRLPSLITRHAAAIVTLCQWHGVRRLAVFGSVVRDDFDPAASDLGFAVQFARTRRRSAAHQYFDFKTELEALLGYPVDLVELRAMPEGTLGRIIEESQIPLYAESA